MDPYEANPVAEEECSDDLESGLPESVWTLDLDDLEPEPPPPPPPMYPDRPERPRCSYYMRTGRCDFGYTCRFHHPRDRCVVDRAPRTGSAEHPEHKSRNTCRYFAKNRNCHYGDACKFEHSKQDGYELPPWTKSYVFNSSQVPSAPSLRQRCPVITSLESSNRSVLPSPYVKGPYGQLLLLPGLLQNIRWGTFQATNINPQHTDARGEARHGSVLSAHVSPFYPGSAGHRATTSVHGESPFGSESEFPPLPSSASATTQRGALQGESQHHSPYPPMDSSAGTSTSGEEATDGRLLPERLDEPEFQNRDTPGFF